MSTSASPALNATSIPRPKAVRPIPIALSMRINADGQGTRPPLAPRAIRLPRLTLPEGITWECSIPSCEWVWTKP